MQCNYYIDLNTSRIVNLIIMDVWKYVRLNVQQVLDIWLLPYFIANNIGG